MATVISFSCRSFLLVEGEADKVGRTVEEETAARHLMVIAVDAIEITVEQ